MVILIRVPFIKQLNIITTYRTYGMQLYALTIRWLNTLDTAYTGYNLLAKALIYVAMRCTLQFYREYNTAVYSTDYCIDPTYRTRIRMF